MYVTTDYVWGMAGITSEEVSEANVTNAILAAESAVDRLTNTTYWAVEDSGTAASATSTTITETSAGWTADAYIDEYVWVYEGVGVGQVRLITDNDTDTLTVSAWTTNPDNTSKFRIIHTGTEAHIVEELRDGDDTNEIFLDNSPLRVLEQVVVDSVTASTTAIYQYKEQARIVLKTTAQATFFPSREAQLTDLDYWFGVYPMIELVKRLTGTYASIFILQTQMGGTHNIPSTYSLPEGSVTIGQAYINIKGTWDTLMRNKTYLEDIIPKYASFFA